MNNWCIIKFFSWKRSMDWPLSDHPHLGALSHLHFLSFVAKWLERLEQKKAKGECDQFFHSSLVWHPLDRRLQALPPSLWELPWLCWGFCLKTPHAVPQASFSGSDKNVILLRAPSVPVPCHLRHTPFEEKPLKKISVSLPYFPYKILNHTYTHTRTQSIYTLYMYIYIIYVYIHDI